MSEDAVKRLYGKTIKSIEFLKEGIRITTVEGPSVSVTWPKPLPKKYVVGIMPPSTPDINYWLDRWEVIAARNEQEAIDEWIEAREGWIRPDEKRYVRVWDTFPGNELTLPVNWRKRYKDKILRGDLP